MFLKLKIHFRYKERLTRILKFNLSFVNWFVHLHCYSVVHVNSKQITGPQETNQTDTISHQIPYLKNPSDNVYML